MIQRQPLFSKSQPAIITEPTFPIAWIWMTIQRANDCTSVTSWWYGDFKGNDSNARGGISNRDLLGVCCFSNNKLTHKSFKIILIIFCAVLADAAGWQDPGLHPESPIKVTYVPTCCFAASRPNPFQTISYHIISYYIVYPVNPPSSFQILP